jgi:hypothetical protein
MFAPIMAAIHVPCASRRGGVAFGFFFWHFAWLLLRDWLWQVWRPKIFGFEVFKVDHIWLNAHNEAIKVRDQADE